MNPSPESVTVAIALLAVMAAYALFSGADCGGGIWDALAGGPRRGAGPRAAVRRSVTPVWEANNVWIVFGLVIVWTAFPAAFAAVMTALFVPLALSLLGIVLRITGFVFREEAQRLPLRQLTMWLFAGSSVVAPFFLGTAVGAVTTGKVRADATGTVLAAWVSPVALVTGALFVAACAYIGAVYLVGDSSRREEPDLVRYFSRRAIASGLLTGLLAAVNLGLMHGGAPYVFGRLLHTAYPLVAVSAAAGVAALALVVFRRPRLLRAAAGLAVASVVGAWGWAQYPWLLPRTLSLQAGSAPASALAAELAVVAAAAVFVVPAFAYLYWLQQHGQLRAGGTSAQLLQAARQEEREQSPAAAGPPDRHHPVVVAVIIGAAAAEFARDNVPRLLARRRHGR